MTEKEIGSFEKNSLEILKVRLTLSELRRLIDKAMAELELGGESMRKRRSPLTHSGHKDV